jgi:hypothetical protein
MLPICLHGLGKGHLKTKHVACSVRQVMPPTTGILKMSEYSLAPRSIGLTIHLRAECSDKQRPRRRCFTTSKNDCSSDD